MKGRIAVAVATAVVVMVTPAAQAIAKGTAYIAGNGAAGAVAAHSIGTNGGLTLLGTAGAGNTPRSVAITPDARHVYVSNTTDANISGYNVSASGALTPISGPPVPAGTGAEGLAIAPSGQFLYVANTGMVGGDSISGYSINSTTGALTPVPGTSFPATSVNGVAITPDGARLYASTDAGGGGIRAFDIGASGALTSVGGLNPAGTTPEAVAITPNGQFLYVANSGGSNLSGFSIGAGGALTSLGATATNANPFGLAIDQSGQFLYTANNIAPGTVNAFAIGPNGGLIPVPAQPFSATSNLSYAADAAPNGRLYISNEVATTTPGTVSVFDRAANGSLAQIGGSPFNAGVNGPQFQSIAITPNQGPTAQFTGGPFEHRSTAASRTAGFDATGSTDPDGGTIGRYDWAFGDGSTLADGGPTPLHVYASPGSYQVTLRVFDDEGCSATTLFTGQTADCNGSSAAILAQAIQVGTDTVPDLTLTAKATQKLKKTVAVNAQTIDTTQAVAKGKLKIQGPKKGKAARKSFSLKKDKAVLVGGAIVKLTPGLSKKAFKLAKRALQAGGRVGAKVTVKVRDADGDTDKSAVKIKLTK